mmetsp:Transcript_1404/g.3870  ORF Transcript_1404/g.3870 Transcript_1404/m.3870 type:complete len:323 (+) Transcript_1404:487-1455(+)
MRWVGIGLGGRRRRRHRRRHCGRTIGTFPFSALLRSARPPPPGRSVVHGPPQRRKIDVGGHVGHSRLAQHVNLTVSLEGPQRIGAPLPAVIHDEGGSSALADHGRYVLNEHHPLRADFQDISGLGIVRPGGVRADHVPALVDVEEGAHRGGGVGGKDVPEAGTDLLPPPRFAVELRSRGPLVRFGLYEHGIYRSTARPIFFGRVTAAAIAIAIAAARKLGHVVRLLLPHGHVDQTFPPSLLGLLKDVDGKGVDELLTNDEHGHGRIVVVAPPVGGSGRDRQKVFVPRHGDGVRIAVVGVFELVVGVLFFRGGDGGAFFALLR